MSACEDAQVPIEVVGDRFGEVNGQVLSPREPVVENGNIQSGVSKVAAGIGFSFSRG